MTDAQPFNPFPQQVVSSFDNILHELDKALRDNLWAQRLARGAGRPASHVALAIFAFLALWVLVCFGASPLASLVGFVYPIYASFKVIESSSKEDDTAWLTYWVVYGFFHMAEQFTTAFTDYIPLYYFLKTAFLLWCALPQFRGAALIYAKLIAPILRRYEADIDAKLRLGRVGLFHAKSVFARVPRPVDVQLTNDEFPPEGVLPPAVEPRTFSINVHLAENVRVADMNGLSDPYVIAYWEGDDCKNYDPIKYRYKTGVVQKCLNPVWNELLELPWKPESRVLVLDVMDEDLGPQVDDFLGRVRIRVEDMLDQTPMSLELQPRESDSDKEKKLTTGRLAVSFSLTKLVVEALRGDSLAGMDMNGKSDPYLEMYWKGDDAKHSRRTKVFPSNLYPEWNETFEFDWVPPKVNAFVIECWDYDSLVKNDFLGYVEVDVPTLKRCTELQFPLKGVLKNGKDAKGTVFLKFDRKKLPLKK